MYYDISLLFFFLLDYTTSLVYEKIDAQSFKKEDIIYVEDDIPSKITCVHKCLYMQADALYNDLKCHCLKKGSDANGNGNENVVTGIHLKSVGKMINLEVKKKSTATSTTAPSLPAVTPPKTTKTCTDETTSFTDYLAGQVKEFRLHHLECSTDGSKVITEMQYQHDSDTKKFRFSFKCCNQRMACNHVSKKTPDKTLTNNNFLLDLKSHNVDCENGFLTDVKFEETQGKGQGYYSYGCCPQDSTIKCKDKESTKKPVTNFHNTKLLRNYPISCDDGYGLSSFRLATPYTKNDQKVSVW